MDERANLPYELAMQLPASRALLAPTLAALCLASPADICAKPSWANASDKAEERGHTFICEGLGRNEDDAVAAALGVCNDKVCRVCGVEVVSTLQTKETLKSVDVERVVTERCRRVRRRDTTIEYRSVDCEPSGCTAWVRVFYSKDDEHAECSRYADENFADPEKCEKDIDEFSKLQGHSAESFVRRRAQLDAALADCREIDVRPTPALMALDAKLVAGLDRFEFTSQQEDKLVRRTEHAEFPSIARRDALDSMEEDGVYFLRTPPDMREQLRETKTLIGRLQTIRDYVHSRALVFAVFDAAHAADLDSAAGVRRLLDAMRVAPRGRPYNAMDDINFFALYYLYRVKADVREIKVFMREAYPVETLVKNGTFLGQDGRMARFFAADGKVGPDEWNYIIASHKEYTCDYCLHALLRAQDHGGDEIRLRRVMAAYDTLPANDPDRVSALNHRYQKFMPTEDGAFLLRIEQKLLPEMRTWYDARMWEQVMSAAVQAKSPELPKLAERYLEALAQKPVTEKERD